MNKNSKRNTIIATIIATIFFISIGCCSFLINIFSTIDYPDSTSVGNIDYDDLVDVTIGYQWFTDYSEQVRTPETISGYGSITTNGNEIISYNYVTISNVNEYNTLNDFYKSYSGVTSNIPNNTAPASFYACKTNEELSIKEGSTRITIYYNPSNPIVYTPESTSGCGSTTPASYKGQYCIYKQDIEQLYISVNSSDISYSGPSVKTFSIPKNSCLDERIIFSYVNNIYDNKTYRFLKFVKEINNNPSIGSFDLNNTPITDDINLYAVYTTTQTSIEGKYYDLTSTINNTKNGTIKIYSGNSEAYLNVTNDLTYFGIDKSFNLGDVNTLTTINEGVTVNFCLNDGSVSLENTTTENMQRVEPDTNYLQYKIVLQNDLNLNGTMTIASRYGSWKNIYQEGNIADAYVWLDLNGHNINIGPNGTLENYGLITDSKGDGCINVNGGTLQSITVIQDYKGGSSTDGATSSKTFPFVLYHIPYLRCSTKFYYDASNNSWGKLIGFVNIRATNEQLGGLIPIQHGNALIHFLGNDGQSFFQLEVPTQSGAYIGLNIEKNDIISKNISNYASNSMYTKCLDYRMKWSFNNIVFKFYPIEVELISVSVQTKEYSFPISPFFDIYINNSELTFSQKINLLPGSSMILDKNSKLIFDYVSNDTNSTANFFVFDKPIYFYNNEKTYFYNKAFPTAPGTGNEFWSSNVYWKYYDAPICYNYGQTLFKQGNPSSQPYVLAGNYNFNKIGYIDSNNNVHIVEDDSNETIFEKLNNNNTYVNTISYDYISSSRYSGLGGSAHEAINVKSYGLPLISYGYAYINYNGNYIKGTWDEDNYLIVSGNDNYFIYLETVTYNTTPSLDILDSKSISVQQISSINLDNKTIIYNNGTYALFAGLYLPLSFDGTIYKANMARLYYDKDDSSKSIKTVTFSDGYWHI